MNDPFKITAHDDLYLWDMLWADAEINWREPPSTVFEAQSRLIKDNNLRADLHLECLVAWLHAGGQIINEADTIERAHYGAQLFVSAIVNGVEDLLGRRVTPTYALLCRAPWAHQHEMPFTKRVRSVFHPESAGVLFTYDGIEFGLAHGLAIAYWKLGDPLPVVRK